MSETVKISFLGDCCLTDGVEDLVNKDPHYKIVNGIQADLGDDSLLVANIECAISNLGVANPQKYATLRAGSQCVSALSGIHAAVLANNHVGDFGTEAMLDTKQNLEKRNILSIGVGKTIDQAAKPGVLVKDGVRVGVLAFSCITTNGDNYATDQKGGVPPIYLPLIEKAIMQSKAACDAVFVVLHWGEEGIHEPNLDQLRLSRALVEMGADAIVGMHAHVIQAYEQYKGKWIFYGLGNFIFPSIVCTHFDEYGKKSSHQLERRASERESLVPEFLITKKSGRVEISLKQILCVGFDNSLVPLTVSEDSLTIDLNRLNCELQHFVETQSYRLTASEAPDYRAKLRYETGVAGYYYMTKPFSAYSLGWRRVLSQRLKFLRLPYRMARRALRALSQHL